jgi:hypothetical protein
MKLVVILVLACVMCGGEVRGQALLAGADPTVASTPATMPPPNGANVGTRVFRSSVDLVSLNVIATDPKDKFVTGLAEGDFAVFEDGVQQDMTFFEAANVPLDLAILLDTSASMAERLSTVQEAAVGFASHLRQGDRVAVISIKDGARMLHPLDGDVGGACEAIRHTAAGGGTALYNAIYTTIKQMQKIHEREGDIRREAIAVLSDGDDTTSLVTFDDLLALAKQTSVAIYTIALKSPYQTLMSGNRKYFDESDYAMKRWPRRRGRGRSSRPRSASLAVSMTRSPRNSPMNTRWGTRPRIHVVTVATVASSYVSPSPTSGSAREPATRPKVLRVRSR